MSKESAGILLFRRRAVSPEVLLAHPGGPFWKTKDDGAWSIPKGEIDDNESIEAAARREFSEEMGTSVEGPLQSLGTVRQPGGKVVHAFTAERDFDPCGLRSNTCLVEWPPKSGRSLEIPEIDRAAWFGLEEAKTKLMRGQLPFLDRLVAILDGDQGPKAGAKL